MNTESNSVPESGPGSATPATESRSNSGVGARRYKTRPFYWSVWREGWENRSIYIVPVIVAAVQVVVVAITTRGLAERTRAALALWHAPIYGWLLLVSGWVRRATFLWAVLPLLAISIFERITFGTSYFGAFVKDRLIGFGPGAFDFHGRDNPTINSLAQLTPGRYLSSPGLWIGLVFAVAFLVAAIRLRRYRGPI